MKETKKTYPHSIAKTYFFKAFHNGNFKNENHPDNVKRENLFKVIIRCKSSELNEENIVTDFREIESVINSLDGKYLNEFLNEKAITFEYIAKYICTKIHNCFICVITELDKDTIITKNDEENTASFYREL